jgi:signal transduction histidine kinase
VSASTHPDGAAVGVSPAAPSGVPARPRGLPRLAVALAIGCAVTVVVALLVAAGNQSWRELVDGHSIIGAVIGVTFPAVGAFVLTREPRHALAWIFVAIGLTQAVGLLATAWSVRRPPLPGAGAAAVVADVVWMPGFVLAAGLISPLFPDGRPASPRWRPVVWVGAAVAVLVTVALPFLDPGDLATGRRSPLAPGPPVQDVLRTVLLTSAGVAAACGVTGAVGIAVRMARTRGPERRRLAWFFVAFVVVFVCQALPVNVVIPTIATGLFPVALGVAMVREGLFDGDRLLNRTLVYGVLTTLVAAVFGLVAGLASRAIGGPTSGAVVAAVVVALGLAPVRHSVQRRVDRLLYGERRDPYGAVLGLGERLEATMAPDEVLPAVVSTVATSLRLPYAAVTLAGEPLPAAEHGTPTAGTVHLPLWHAGSEVGILTVGLPGTRRFLDPGDQRLLEGFARQVAVAADAVRLTHQLRRSRDQLALAREEERHRIRRDLHDGLGPTLAGVALGLGAARRSATGDGAELLEHLQREVDDSLADVKRLVADLRPTTLEQLGLQEALLQYAETVTVRSEGALVVRVETARPLGPLPAETEVAIYRIVLEAVTNVARHATASSCVVRLDDTTDPLTLTVEDDGVGLAAARHGRRRGPGGLGLRSMTERATELGGTCMITPGAAGGTTVHVTIPRGGTA